MNLGPDTSILILIADLVANGDINSRLNILSYLTFLHDKFEITTEDFGKAWKLIAQLNQMEQEYKDAKSDS